jgi:hypothetical protein
MSFKSTLELQKFKIIQNSYQGRVKINLKNLEFKQNPTLCRRETIPAKLERLINIFSLEGCRRLEPLYYIPAIIDEEVLQNALLNSNLQPEDILKPGEPFTLNLGLEKIEYLRGLHRIEAARQFLDAFDEWWIVNLYTNEGI